MTKLSYKKFTLQNQKKKHKLKLLLCSILIFNDKLNRFLAAKSNDFPIKTNIYYYYYCSINIKLYNFVQINF